MNAESLPFNLHQSRSWTQPDPGNAGTITIFKGFAQIPLVSAGAETRTLARPTRQGVFCSLYVQTYVGNITLTVTGNYNTNGNSTIVLSAAGQFVLFESFFDGTNYYWELVGSSFLSNSGEILPPSAKYVTATTTLTVTAALHAGKTILLSAVAGFTSTLPAASGSFNTYTFEVLTTLTSGAYIINAKTPGASFFGGVACMGGSTSNVFSTATGASNVITMTGAAGTTGGFAGDRIQLQDIATNQWSVQAFIASTGTAATIFSST